MLSSACRQLPSQASTPPTGASTQPPPSIGAVALRRYGCFGRCPAYQVSIAADGTVEYRGYAHVAALGSRTGHADPGAWTRLWRLLDSAEFAAVEDSYLPGRSGCGAWSSDGEMIVLKLWIGGRRREIHDYTGCRAVPAPLRWAEAAVDAAARDGEWVTGSAGR